MDNNTYRYSTHIPLYPFGYGLSYSRFRYYDLDILTPAIKVGETVKVSAVVENLGPYDADEVSFAALLVVVLCLFEIF